MELPSEWLEFLNLLQRHDARFIIVGAYAMAALGRPRSTQDMDIFVEPSADNAIRVDLLDIELLKESGLWEGD